MKSSFDYVMAFTRAAADFQAQLVLMVVYFTVIAPFGLVVRLQAGSKSQLPTSHWSKREDSACSLESVRRQF